MHHAIIFLIKMIVCSAILLAYYWLALRNERFHHWNRFFLLTAMLLSVVLPFVTIPFLQQENPTAVVTMIGALPWNYLPVEKAAGFEWGWKESGMLVTIIISLAMFIHLLLSVFRVVRLYKSHMKTYIHEVNVVITKEESAPFSFFKWLFWRADIDPESENGKRMLQHELTHITEKHSADKLFTELLLIAFWMNPFFWLMRRELYAIHEFLADQKAIARHDGAAFATMILQAAHPGKHISLSNPFFTSHLKRRLIMITTSHAPKFSYMRRISGLVLMLFTSLLLVLNIDNATAQKAPPPPPPKKVIAPPPPPVPPLTEQLPDSILSAGVIDNKGKTMVVYKMKDGRKLVLGLNEAKQKGYPIPPPPPPVPAPPAPPASVDSGAAALPLPAIETAPSVQVKATAETPMYIYAGLEITEEQVRKIPSEQIQEVQVFKGEEAIKQYGEKGRNGVVKIVPRNANYSQQKEKDTYNPNLAAATVKATTDGKPVPLYVLDGKRITEKEMRGLDPNKIAAINVLKDKMATDKYGDSGKNGVVKLLQNPLANNACRFFWLQQLMKKTKGTQGSALGAFCLPA